MKCPVCSTDVFTPVVGTPYYRCSKCSLWYQSPFPPKRYESAAEAPGNQMSDRDKDINKSLANWLFENVLRGEAGKVLDCGAKYSWIGKCFSDLGCDVTAIDGIDEVVPFSEELGIKGICHDIESDKPLGETYDLIILCHVLEHFYKPVETIVKLHWLLNPNGKMFIRCPDSDSEGISRDLNPFHYSIHPCVYNEKSVRNLLKQTNSFTVLSTNPLLGQRDYIVERT